MDTKSRIAATASLLIFAGILTLYFEGFANNMNAVDQINNAGPDLQWSLNTAVLWLGTALTAGVIWLQPALNLLQGEHNT